MSLPATRSVLPAFRASAVTSRAPAGSTSGVLSAAGASASSSPRVSAIGCRLTSRLFGKDTATGRLSPLASPRPVSGSRSASRPAEDEVRLRRGALLSCGAPAPRGAALECASPSAPTRGGACESPESTTAGSADPDAGVRPETSRRLANGTPSVGAAGLGDNASSAARENLGDGVSSAPGSGLADGASRTVAAGLGDGALSSSGAGLADSVSSAAAALITTTSVVALGPIIGTARASACAEPCSRRTVTGEANAGELTDSSLPAEAGIGAGFAPPLSSLEAPGTALARGGPGSASADAGACSGEPSACTSSPFVPAVVGARAGGVAMALWPPARASGGISEPGSVSSVGANHAESGLVSGGERPTLISAKTT